MYTASDYAKERGVGYGVETPTDATKTKKPLNPATKEGLIQGGLGAGGALLSVIAKLLLDEDESERARVSMPSTSVGGVNRTATPQLNLARQGIQPSRSELAQALIGRAK